jgi:hypothetical protein
MSWIGFDGDGTLWKHGTGEDIPGDPIPAMVEILRQEAKAYEVRILTARAGIPEQIPIIEDWCIKHLGMKLKVTDRKDFGMLRLYDDRAIQVVTNTGKLVL